MADASIPAWKRAGLKQAKQTPKKSQAGYDPLKEGLKRADESGDAAKPSRPAKRTKVAKADRPASTHEPDQLAYLRQYQEDRSNWKFSKQKQNWILKHTFTDDIDARYEPALVSYIEGLMGSARNWVAEDARKVVNDWNVFMKKSLDDKDETVSASSSSAEAAKANKTEGAAAAGEPSKDSTSTPSGADDGEQKGRKRKTAPSPPKQQPAVPKEGLARRAQKLLELLTKEHVPLEFLDKAGPAEEDQ